MERQFPQRKPMRLNGFDYRQVGYYFVTICTQVRRENVLCSISPMLTGMDVGAAALGGPCVALTDAGAIVEHYIQNIDQTYHKRVCVDCYVIMPDHIHLIIHLRVPEDGPPRAAAPTPALSDVINALKGLSRKKIGYPIWQRGYYDHIIRNETDLQSIRQYIQNNPFNWVLDQP